MANWQTFKVLGVTRGEQWTDSHKFNYVYLIELDKYVEYSNGYKKHIEVECLDSKVSRAGMSCGRSGEQYIEIDIDRTKRISSGEWVPRDAWREVPNEVVSSRVLAKAESLDPQVSAHISDGISRMNRGEIREFEHKMEDNSGNRHQFIYRKNW